ncbi:MAG: hypothetical protein V4724_19815 [Pseudomonadota bacterium]
MDTIIPLCLSRQTVFDLQDYLFDHSDCADLPQLIRQVIEEWIGARQTSWQLDEQAKLNGYLWKSLFLPEGTRLMTKYRGVSRTATVENGRIVCDECAMSPRQFAHAAGGTGRNAWQTIWIRLPGEKFWKQAAACRPKSCKTL